jgi:hypothetical protein
MSKIPFGESVLAPHKYPDGYFYAGELWRSGKTFMASKACIKSAIKERSEAAIPSGKRQFRQTDIRS